jgi:hypothetical protein
MNINFSTFQGRYPYASSLFGVYQPLIGWKARRMAHRFSRGAGYFNDKLVPYVASKFYPDVRVTAREATHVEIERFQVGTLQLESRSGPAYPVDSLVAQHVLDLIIRAGLTQGMLKVYDNILTKAALNDALAAVGPKLIDLAMSEAAQSPLAAENGNDNLARTVKRLADRESVIAGVLNYLYEGGPETHAVLDSFFFPNTATASLVDFNGWKKFVDPLEMFDPKLDIGNVALSPIGIIHLFTQHFSNLTPSSAPLSSTSGSAQGAPWSSSRSTRAACSPSARSKSG